MDINILISVLYHMHNRYIYIDIYIRSIIVRIFYLFLFI